MKNLIVFIIAIAFISCKKETKITQPQPNDGKEMPLKYAKGFSVTDFETHKILTIKNPWQNADKMFRFALIQNQKKATINIKNQKFDAVIKTPIQSIVVTSTTHIPALELLNVEQTLVGFPNTAYISSEKTRQRIDNNLVKELGNNEAINTEILLELNPDLIVSFGIDGQNKTLEIAKKVNIPVVYNGDWVEDSPLAKAEWIKFFGVLFNKEKEADSIFNQIETNYLEAKKLASQIKRKPTVLCGAMQKDIWYLPNGLSNEAQLLKDANINYLWSDTTGKGSLGLSFETVFEKGKNADFWISPSHYKSMNALQNSNPHYEKFEAFQHKKVYTFSNTTGKTGGVLYYELGTARPDLVLKDLIKICHPELLKNHNFFFYKPLQ